MSTCASESASASTAVNGDENGKPLVVRVKRKRLRPPLDALWLEINERPYKRQDKGGRGHEVSLEESVASLSLSSASNADGIPNRKKLLFHHVETVSCSDEEKGILESVLITREDKKLQGRHREQREGIKKSKDKQDQLRSSAREKHEIDAKNARFKQVWRSRKGLAENTYDAAISELYHLYDVVRVDEEEEMSMKFSRREKAKSDAVMHEDQVLCNYLPSTREYLPSAAAEFEAQLHSLQTTQKDDYVYDVYTLGKTGNVAEDVAAAYPLVQVEEDDDFYHGDLPESDVDTEDSNDENNPLNEYSDEESDTDDECRSKNSFDSEECDIIDEDEGAGSFESDEEDRRWSCRR